MSINHIFNGGFYESINPAAWSNVISGGGGGGGVVSITGSANQIDIGGTSSNPIIQFPITGIDTASITVNSAYTMPTSIGSVNQVLAVPPTGTNLVWANDASGSGTVTNVTSADANISVSNGSTTPVLTLASTINVTGAIVNTFKNIYTTNPIISGQVLSSDTSGNLSWASAGTSNSLVANLTFNATNPSSTLTFTLNNCYFLNNDGVKSINLPFTQLANGLTIPSGSNPAVLYATLPTSWGSSDVYQGCGFTCPVYEVSGSPGAWTIIDVHQFNITIVAEISHEIAIVMTDPTKTGTNVLVPFNAGSTYLINPFIGTLGGQVQPYTQALLGTYY